MSIPLDCLYHYIENIAKEVCGDDVLIYRFWPHGSKNINDLQFIKDYSNNESSYRIELMCHDQEPLNYNLYKDVPIRLDKTFEFVGEPSILPKRNLRVKVANIYDKCLLLHSERHSPEVIRYQQDQFVPVYYWCHAIIARDWFRYAQHVNFSKDIKKTFLIYNRAWTGTREYRLKFVDLLIKNNLLEHCKTSFNPIDNGQYYKNHAFVNQEWKPTETLEQYLSPTQALSCQSAEFDVNDYNSTEFEIVLETLFDDQRQQLTEKILRPIACKQPFLLATAAGGLKYLRSYGFQTFGEVFDESYDLVVNPVERMQKIIETMKDIATWTPEYKAIQMKKIKHITEFNQTHFFSEEFFNTVITELKDNLIPAFEHVENTNIGLTYRDLKIKNIPGMRQFRRNPAVKYDRIKALKKIKEYRKRNRKIVK
jgi:hypothetical protein